MKTPNIETQLHERAVSQKISNISIALKPTRLATDLSSCILPRPHRNPQFYLFKIAEHATNDVRQRSAGIMACGARDDHANRHRRSIGQRRPGNVLTGPRELITHDPDDKDRNCGAHHLAAWPAATSPLPGRIVPAGRGLGASKGGVPSSRRRPADIMPAR